MTLFEAIFTPQESGDFEFRIENPDDNNAIWLDLDQDGIFDRNGLNGDELIVVRNSYSSATFYSGIYALSAGEDYKIAFAHGEGGGGSRLKPWIQTPSLEWQIVDPSDPAQDGMFSVPFDGNVSDDISPYVIARHGGIERIVLRDGKAAVFHDLESSSSAISPNTFGDCTTTHAVSSSIKSNTL